MLGQASIHQQESIENPFLTSLSYHYVLKVDAATKWLVTVQANKEPCQPSQHVILLLIIALMITIPSTPTSHPPSP